MDVDRSKLQRGHSGAERTVLACILLVLAGLLGVSQYKRYVAIETDQQERLARQVEVVEKNLMPLIVGTKRALDGVIEELPKWATQKEGIDQYIRRLKVISDTLTGVNAVFVVNARGKVIASSVERLVGIDVSSRAYFDEIMRRRSPQTLYVTAPFVNAAGNLSISLVREVVGPNGEFDGLVIVGLDPAFFNTLLDSVRYQPDVEASLIHGDGKLFTMSPIKKEILGRDMSDPQSFFSRHRGSGKPASVFFGSSVLTGGERAIALRTIDLANLGGDKPLIVNVSRDLKAIFAPWRQEVIRDWTIFGLMALTAILTLIFYQRRRRILEGLLDVQETLRQQAESDLSHSENRYRTLVEWTPDPLLVHRDGKFIYANPAAAEMFGAGSADKLVGTAVLDRIHPDFREVVLGRVKHFLEHGGTAPMTEEKMLKLDGTVIDVEAQGTMISYDGRPAIQVVMHDITERKKAERLLLESEAHLQAIVANEPECIKIVDAQGLLVQMNPAGLAMIEASSLEQVKGASVLGLIVPEYREAFMQMHKRVIAGQAQKMEFEMMGLHGGRHWMETHAVPMKTRGETVQLAITRDITERKQMEEQVRQLAFYDSLTNLPNRRLLLDRLDQAMSAGKRTGRCGALIFVDLDNFKPLNDTHGHAAGDLLLIEVARRLTSSVREIDTVSRFGGDEFAVLISDLVADKVESTKEVGSIAEKIRIKLAEPYVLSVRHEGDTVTTVEHRCSASIGVLVFKSHEFSQEDILRRADKAMYRAKDAGRNTIIFSEADDAFG